MMVGLSLFRTLDNIWKYSNLEDRRHDINLWTVPEQDSGGHLGVLPPGDK